MSSSQQPVYWGTALIAIDTQTGSGVDYSLAFPPGTTGWKITNISTSGTAADRAFIAETLAQAQSAACPVQLLPLATSPAFLELASLEVESPSGAFISGTAAATASATMNLTLAVGWHRIGRQPDGMDAGSITLTAL
jgi:hypothetical protein